MSDMTPILRRFAEHAFEVRRRCVLDPEFRAICEDYAAATAALTHWERDQSKAEDYRRLIRELEDEVLEYLRKPTDGPKKGD